MGALRAFEAQKTASLPTWAMGVSPALTLLEDNGVGGAASGLEGGLPEAKGWL